MSEASDRQPPDPPEGLPDDLPEGLPDTLPEGLLDSLPDGGQVAGIGPPGPEGQIPVAWSIDRPPRPSKLGFVHRPQPHMDSAYPGGMTLPVLQTARLTLCGLGEPDLDDFARLQYDPRVAKWFGGVPDPPHDRARQREETWRVMAALLGHWALRGYGQWALVHTATGRFIGRAGLWKPEGWPGVEVGWLVDADLWGQGFATEAGRAAVDFAFDRLELDGVISVTIPHNGASRRVMEKVGLTDTGRRVDLRGHEQVLYRISREEWIDDVQPMPARVAQEGVADPPDEGGVLAQQEGRSDA